MRGEEAYRLEPPGAQTCGGPLSFHASRPTPDVLVTLVSCVSLIAFALTWLLREVPLRTHAYSGEGVPAPADEDAASRAAA